MEKYKSINDAAIELGVSSATIRNWIKNGSLQCLSDDKNYVLDASINKLKQEIENGQNSRLKARRNKSKIKGNHLSKKYISNSILFEKACDILEALDHELCEAEIRVILCEYCFKLLSIKHGIKLDSGLALLQLDSFKADSADYLAAYALIEDIKDVEKIINENLKALSIDIFSSDEDFIGLLSMGLKSLGDRKAGGVYFTPTSVVNKMMDVVTEKQGTKGTIADICCGSGNFLLAALKRGFDYHNIYGFDIDDVSVKIAIFNIAYNCEEADYNVLISNFRTLNSLEYCERKFDICIGNPPWGSDIDCNDPYIRFNFECAVGNADAFDLFLEKGLKLISDGGYLYYVVPESLINVASHCNIRAVIQGVSSLDDLIYWGNIFDGVQAPAISIMLKKGVTHAFEIGATIRNEREIYQILKNRNISKNAWNIGMNDEEYSLINDVANKNCLYLYNNADFALGIVTGDNKKYVLDVPTNKSSKLVKGSNIYKYSIQFENHYIEFEPDNFQQVAKREYYFAKEKLLYRFISDTLVFAYDNQQTLSLNSANIVIPRLQGYDIKYILAVLNSSFSHFFFKKKYSSIKVLRNHIESIPIPVASDLKQNEIIELVNEMLTEENSEKRILLYEKIDNLILDLYSFSDDEKRTIIHSRPQNLFLY